MTFINDPPLAPAAPSADARAESSAAMWSLVIGAILLLLKFGAYYLTGSAAVFSDAMESIVNVVASAMTVYAVSLAHAPADPKHPYGHGKVEFISSAFEGGMLAAATIVMIVQAIESLRHGVAVEQINVGIVLMLVAMIANGGLGFFLIRQGKTGGSIALEGSGHHLLSDAVTSIGVLLALFLVKVTGQRWIDPLTAAIVAIYAGIVATTLMRRSFAGLMDEQDLADDKMLHELLQKHVTPAGEKNGQHGEPTICSFHKLRHRHNGRYHWIEFHLVVPADWSINQGHRVASRIEAEIEDALGDASATAHIEPCNGLTCPSCPKLSPDEINMKRPRVH